MLQIIIMSRVKAKQGSYQPSRVTKDDQSLVEAHWKIINEKMDWSFKFYRVVSKWTQIINGENIFYHLIADGHFNCSVNFFKPLTSEVDVQVTFEALGWVTPRSRKSRESTESMTSSYQKSQPNHLDYILVLASAHTINKVLGQTCKKYSIAKKWVEKLLGCENIFYHLYENSIIDGKKFSVNFLVTSKHIGPRITFACEGWVTPRSRQIQKSGIESYKPSPVTKEDKEFMRIQRDTINQKLGWSSAFYTPSFKWTQGISGGMYIFYHLVADRHILCSVRYFKSLEGYKELIFACQGWVRPQKRPETNNQVVGPEKVQVEERDSKLIHRFLKEINKNGGWKHPNYRPVEKWVRLTNGTQIIFHLLDDVDFKCTVYLHKPSTQGPIAFKRAEEGWVPII